MNDEAFEQFLADALAALDAKQADLQARFQLGAWTRWSFDQAGGRLVFLDAGDQPVVEADIVLLGSHVPAKGHWRWGWDNPSLGAALRERADALKGLEARTGIAVFGLAGGVAADEAMAWELAAMGVEQLGAEGLYRAPGANGVHAYLALERVRGVDR